MKLPLIHVQKMYAILLSFSINNPGNSKKKKINSQLIFKLWKISNYENKKKNVNKFGLPLCVIRRVKSHKWQGNNLQQA